MCQWMPDPSMMLASLPDLDLSAKPYQEGDLYTGVRWVVAHRKRLIGLPHACKHDNIFMLLCSASCVVHKGAGVGRFEKSYNPAAIQH